MTEQEARALAAELECSKTWRVTDIFYTAGGAGFQSGYNIHLVLSDGSAPGYGAVIDDAQQAAKLNETERWLRRQIPLDKHA